MKLAIGMAVCLVTLSLLPLHLSAQVNLAPSGTASQSSTFQGTYVASRAIDGNTDGNFFNNSVASTDAASAYEYWEVDLGTTADIGSVVLWNRTDGTRTDRLGSIWVLVSDSPFPASGSPNAANLNTARAAASFEQQVSANAGGIVSYAIGAVNVSGRYVRVQKSGSNPGGNYLSLAEVQVFERDSSLINMASSGTVSQSSTDVAGGSPDLAIDGNTDGVFGNNSVTATAAATAYDYWEVDLGSVAPIDSIALYNRTDSVSNRLGNVWVLVSDDPFPTSGSPNATNLSDARATAEYEQQLPSSTTSTNLYSFGSVSTSGRYVRVQKSGSNPGGDWLSLAEVEVFRELGADEILGRVFRDLDGDGVRDATESGFGEAGMVVTAYDSSNSVVASAPIGSDGSYSLSGVTFPVRLELSGLPSGLQFSGTGAGSSTGILFVGAAAADANFAVSAPADYCGSNPRLAVTCFVSGDQSNTTAPADTLVSVNYDKTNKTSDGFTTETGAVWGLAYNRTREELFSAAFLKRHSGWGPQGIGGIYVTDYGSGAPGTTSSFIDLTVDPDIDLLNGAPNTLLTNTGRDLPVGPVQDGNARDEVSFDYIGMVGLGDIDISEDNNTLYAVNLAERNIVTVDLTAYNANGTLPGAAEIGELAIGSLPACIDGVARPFALKVYDGNLYVGITCTGENAANNLDNTNVNVVVNALDLSSNVWSTVLTSPAFTHTTGGAHNGQCNQWRPWTGDESRLHIYESFGSPVNYACCDPQPILSDVDFDIDGNMMLGILDRGGHQWGYANYSPNLSDNRLFDFRVAGDVLKAARCGGASSWTLESNGGLCGAPGSASQQNGQGPGGGEFFYEDSFSTHYETSNGSLAVLRGSGEVVMTGMDPLSIFSGGFYYLNNTDGSTNSRFTVFDNAFPYSTFGKANGLGDVELLCDAPPLTVGNRLWHDVNGNGVQDPGEPGIAGVDITLDMGSGTVTVETASDDPSTPWDETGEWYFTNEVGGNAENVLAENGSGTISVDLGDADLGTLTAISIGTGATNDEHDNDANALGVIAITTGGAGENDYSFDIGVVEPPKVALGSTVWIDTGTANGTFDAGEGIAGVEVELYLSGQTPGVDTPVATTTTGTDGVYQFDQLDPGDYIVYIPATEFGGGEPLSGTTSLPGGGVDNNIDNGDDGLDTPENGGIRSNVINLSAGGEIVGEPTQALYTGTLSDDSVNMTVDFGFEPAGALVALGSTVWIDGQGGGTTDGTFDDPGEGVDGVTVELYTADQVPGIDPPLAVTTTSGGGHYHFDNLPEGDYIAHIPAAEFAGGALAGTSSLSGSGGDDGTDHDDNGLDAPVSGGVSSATITLSAGGESSADDDTGYSGSLADDSVDSTVDFGFDASTGAVALGSRVWVDDGDGVYQSGEGADGVTVQLYSDPDGDGDFSDGTLVGTTVTSGDGFYLFDELPEGDYVVHIPASEFASGPLAGATSLAGADGGSLDEDAAGNENGLDTPFDGGISSGSISLTAGGQPSGESSQSDYAGSLADDSVDMTIDFGFAGAAPDPALGNAVFIDENGNGVMDPGEGVNGVAVELYTADQEPGVDTPVRTTTTVADGNYLFDLLPEDDYIVYIPGENFAPGAPLYQYESLPGAGGDDTNDDDVDENGLDQLVNGGVVSAVIQIRDGGEPVNESGSATGPTSVLSDDRVNYTVDFGFHQQPPLGAIGNYVWLDENSDGYQDAGEPGIPNVTVQLKDGSGTVIATTVTDGQGGYLFDELPAGDYFVDIDETTLSAGMTQTTPSTLAGADLGNQDHGGDGYAVTVGGSEPWENLTADFGYNHNPDTDVNNPSGTPVAALGDRVWIDSDNDGAQDPGEVGVGGVELTLITPGTDGIFGTADDVAAGTTTTDQNGNYLFDGLAPGAYQVEVTDSATASHDILGADYDQSGDPDHFGTTGGSNDNLTTTPVVLGPGDVFLNVDFGYNPTSATLGSIGDTVWLDSDADGVQGAGEPGIEGVTVALIQDTNGNGVFDAGDEVIATDTTDSSGSYLFEDLPLDDGGGDGDADYLVWVNDTDNVLGGLTQTYDSDGVLSSPDHSAVAISSGAPDDLDQDFGYTPDVPLGSIGDYVWLDADSDGVQDEPGRRPRRRDSRTARPHRQRRGDDHHRRRRLLPLRRPACRRQHRRSRGRLHRARGRGQLRRRRGARELHQHLRPPTTARPRPTARAAP